MKLGKTPFAILALALASLGIYFNLPGVFAQNTVEPSKPVALGVWSRQPIEAEFDAAYFAAMRPTIKAAYDLTDESERAGIFLSLAEAGELIDVPIHVWRWSPYYTMLARASGGYTWVPSALQPPVIVAPGISFPGLPPYDPDHAPPGSIKVINPHDRSTWPEPIVKPQPAPPVVTSVLVGPSVGRGIWFATTAGRDVPAGQEVAENGLKCLKQITPSMFGDQHFFVCTAAAAQ